MAFDSVETEIHALQGHGFVAKLARLAGTIQDIVLAIEIHDQPTVLDSLRHNASYRADLLIQ